jgi:hypothetical protein
MGIYGFNNWSNINIFSSIDLMHYSVGSVYHGIDWIYTFVETTFMYDFNITYNWFMNNIYQDNFDFNYYSLWYSSLDISYFTLFWSVMLDKVIFLNLLKLPYIDSWFRFLTQNSENSLSLLTCPELFFISDYFLKNLIVPFSTEIDTVIYSMSDEETYLYTALVFPHLLVIGVIVLFFVMLYFSYYNSAVKEEVTIDHDYLIASATVEAEEEIGSLDDMFMSLLIFCYIFFWYFYINCGAIMMVIPEFALTIYLFPLMYYIIMCIPAFLAYDFGLYFVAYLRGVGAAPIMSVELLYDYIAFAAFYIRLIVQNVRLILMIFTFGSFHEFIIFHGIEKELIIGDESFWDDVSKSIKTPSGMAYFLVFKLSGHIIYFFYELVHTIFVVTAQFIAFFAMVFWLFLFLYTMFVSELQEKFYTQKRASRKEYFDRYSSFKLNILSNK